MTWPSPPAPQPPSAPEPRRRPPLPVLLAPVAVALLLVIASGIFVAVRFSDSDRDSSASAAPHRDAGAPIPLSLLRSVDPCGLLNEIPSTAGTLIGKSASFPIWSTCELRTQGGKYGTSAIDLRLDDDARGYTFDTPDAGGRINGLPIGHTSHILAGKPGECGVAVPTESSALVVGLSVSGVGAADPCAVAIEFLTPVVQRLSANPPRHPSPRGSLVALDPCSILDVAALEPIIGRTGAGVPDSSVHKCQWSGTVALGTEFSVERESSITSSSLHHPVTVGSSLFYEEHIVDGMCSYSYIQIPGGASDFAEIVKVAVQSHDPNMNSQLCDKARTAAAALVPKLPKAK